MKKMYAIVLLLSVAMTISASFHLTIEKEIGEELRIVEIIKDTTIVVTDYEYDEDLEEAEMAIEGEMYSDESDSIKVTITRFSTGIVDQFCAAGNCVPGNGELSQELSFTIGSLESMRHWFTHYTPIAIGKETIVYTFDDSVNPAITITVEYDYNGTSVDNVLITPIDNTIYNLLGQRMSATAITELPSGIYIINGKKFIKQ